MSRCLVFVLVISFGCVWGTSAYSSPALGQSSLSERVKRSIERFKLLTPNCGPIRLIVENMSADAKKIGLTKDSIQSAVESRLRSAHIYHSWEVGPFLGVRVGVVGSAFLILLDFNKALNDRVSGQFNYTTTWESHSFGTHGGSFSFILSSLSQLMDEFLVEFLRVNEKACAKKILRKPSR